MMLFNYTIDTTQVSNTSNHEKIETELDKERGRSSNKNIISIALRDGTAGSARTQGGYNVYHTGSLSFTNSGNLMVSGNLSAQTDGTAASSPSATNDTMADVIVFGQSNRPYVFQVASVTKFED